jgi:hypothetical protein
MITYEIIDGVYKGPEHFEGWLDLRGTQVKDLECLESVGRWLDLSGTKVKDLGSLESVGGDLDLRGTPINDLGSLEDVGDALSLQGTSLVSLGNLKHVGDNLNLFRSKVVSLGCLEDVGGWLSLPDGTEVENFKSYKKEADKFLKETPIEDYPLHMNHENWIVKTKVSKFLETGVVK